MASATEIITVICPNLASDTNLPVYLEMARASVPVESPSVMEIKTILALAKNS